MLTNIKAPPTQRPAQPPTPAPKKSLNYQTGFNANSQAVNTGQIKNDFLRESLNKQSVSSQDGQRAINDLQRGMAQNSVAQMGRQHAQQNAQQSTNDMAARSDLMRQGMANQAKIYQDMNQRSIDQAGLAGRLNEAMIRNRFSLMQALLNS
jgi:hypothetical protein